MSFGHCSHVWLGVCHMAKAASDYEILVELVHRLDELDQRLAAIQSHVASVGAGGGLTASASMFERSDLDSGAFKRPMPGLDAHTAALASQVSQGPFAHNDSSQGSAIAHNDQTGQAVNDLAHLREEQARIRHELDAAALRLKEAARQPE